MKNVFLIILYFLLIFKGNAQGLSSSTNDYNYTSYSSIYKNENISGTYITSTSARESILYVTSHPLELKLPMQILRKCLEI